MMATPAPHTKHAVPVEVIEEHGFDAYINMVQDPADPKLHELGRHLDVGPCHVRHTIHFHMGEILSSTERPKTYRLSEPTLNALVTGVNTRLHMTRTAIRHAYEMLDQIGRAHV